jgi:hypothetical protein
MDDEKVMSWWVSELVKHDEVLQHQIKCLQNRLDKLESKVYIKKQ